MIRAEFIDSDSAFQNAVRLHGHLLLSNLFPLHNHKAKFRDLNDGNNCWSGETRELSVDPTTGQHRTYREQYNYIIYFACMHACMQTSQKCWGKHQFTIVISKPSPSTQDFAPSRDEVLIVTKAFEELLQGLQNLGGYLGPESFATKKQYQLSISSESKFMCI